MSGFQSLHNQLIDKCFTHPDELPPFIRNRLGNDDVWWKRYLNALDPLSIVEGIFPSVQLGIEAFGPEQILPEYQSPFGHVLVRPWAQIGLDFPDPYTLNPFQKSNNLITTMIIAK